LLAWQDKLIDKNRLSFVVAKPIVVRIDQKGQAAKEGGQVEVGG